MNKKFISKKKLPDYDFLGSVYKKTKSNELLETLESIKKQTLKPKNIILVIDGFVKKEVKVLIKKYMKVLPIRTITLRENKGLGIALREGLKECKSEIILRFDTDDINLKTRALCIVRELANGTIDIVGSNIYEFTTNPKKRTSVKKVPTSHNSIKKQLIYRNPINHPSVGFLRKSIINLNGGYRDFPFYEDYDLWIRAINNNLIFKNIDKELVAVRITEQRKRRKGVNLIYSEIRLLFTFFKASFWQGLNFLPFLFLRIIFILLPFRIINFIYSKYLRKDSIFK